MAVAANNNRVPLLPTSGRELILDLKRSTGNKNSTLPAYNHKLVQACFRDLHASAQELDLQAQAHRSSGDPSMSGRPSILLHNKTIQRQKQCLLAYHHHRMEIIQNIQREKLASNATAKSKAAISTNAKEVAFAKDYATLRAAYSRQVFELDLLPPISHMVQVKVLSTVGQVVLPDSGKVVSIQKGACLFMDRADAKDFLRQGILQLYDGEEVDC